MDKIDLKLYALGLKLRYLENLEKVAAEYISQQPDGLKVGDKVTLLQSPFGDGTIKNIELSPPLQYLEDNSSIELLYHVSPNKKTVKHMGSTIFRKGDLIKD